LNALIAGLRRSWPLLLVLAPLLLLPVGRTAELPLVLMAGAGLVLGLRRRIDWSAPAVWLAPALFACYWVPALLSTAAAVAPAKTWSTVAVTLRFLPFAVFVAWALRDAAQWPRLLASAGVIIALWALDAWLQALTGWSLGGPAERERISGVFGAGNLKLGPTLAVLAPFVLLAARTRWGGRGLAVAMALLALPILLAGSRAAWLAYAIVLLAVLWRHTRDARRFLWSGAALALAAAALFAAAWHGSLRLDARVERSLLVLHGTEQAIDQASAGRVRIWRTAAAMIRAQPLTGVGVRGFRYAYPRYAAADDAFVDTSSDTGAAHAHQIVLEVLSETGLVGLMCWLGGVWLALRGWRRAASAARERAFAPGLALLAMCFPLNTHLAFYSAWWGLLFWWLLALYCAALASSPAVPARANGERG